MVKGRKLGTNQSLGLLLVGIEGLRTRAAHGDIWGEPTEVRVAGRDLALGEVNLRGRALYSGTRPRVEVWGPQKQGLQQWRKGGPRADSRESSARAPLPGRSRVRTPGDRRRGSFKVKALLSRGWKRWGVAREGLGLTPPPPRSRSSGLRFPSLRPALLPLCAACVS